MSDLHKHARLGGSGGIPSRKVLEIRCSEIASEAILRQKQDVPAKAADIEFPRKKVLKLAGQQMG